MFAKIVSHIAGRPKSLRSNLFRHMCSESALSGLIVQEELDDEPLPWEWYRAAYGKLIRLTRLLNNVEHIDGRTMHAKDAHIAVQTQSFNSLARAFIMSRPVHGACFYTANGRSSLTLDSLTKICKLLNISVPHRKTARLKLCKQVIHLRTWKAVLEEVLCDLRDEMDSLDLHSPSFLLGKQVVLSCQQFIADSTTVSGSDSPSWMKPPPQGKAKLRKPPNPSETWEEVLQMFIDLTECLKTEDKLAVQVSKVEAMKIGLCEIRDITIERDISFREIRRQDTLLQKNLTKCLGHSSKCLFMLLRYYLYGSIREIEVEVRGGVRAGKRHVCAHVGKILTGSDEKTVMNGVKQLNKALGLLKLVWDNAEMNKVLEVQGHLWCVGVEERNLTYRGNVFFLHCIRL